MIQTMYIPQLEPSGFKQRYLIISHKDNNGTAVPPSLEPGQTHIGTERVKEGIIEFKNHNTNI